MSRFKNALNARDAHIWTLRGTCVLLILVCLVLALGWMNAPRNLTIHQPPDLRSGSTRPWWEVPPSTVYAFGFYVFQQLNSWPKDGEQDYPARIKSLSPYLTPECQTLLEDDARKRNFSGELRERVRGIYEIPDEVTAAIGWRLSIATIGLSGSTSPPMSITTTNRSNAR